MTTHPFHSLALCKRCGWPSSGREDRMIATTKKKPKRAPTALDRMACPGDCGPCENNDQCQGNLPVDGDDPFDVETRAKRRSNRIDEQSGPLTLVASNMVGGRPSRDDHQVGKADSRPSHNAGQIVLLPVESIRPCRFQPRQEFPKDEIQALADSMKADGQAHAIVVRDLPGFRPIRPDYELVDGERRLRAAKLLKWPTIRAEIRDYTDAQVRSIVLATAIQRRDLSAVEEAKAFQAAIDAGDAPGPSELARRLGVSQGHVSNRLRLLELPPRIQAKVISREITPTAARDLVPLAGVKPVMDGLAGKKLAGKPDAEVEKIVRDLIRDKCRRLDRTDWDYASSARIPAPTFTPEQRAELQVFEAKEAWGNKKVEYAANAKAFDRFYQAHKKAVVAKSGKKPKKKAAAGKGTKSAKEPKEKPLSDEQRAEKKRTWLYTATRWLIAHEADGLDDRQVLLAILAGYMVAGEDSFTCWDLARMVGLKTSGHANKVLAAVAGRLYAADVNELVTIARSAVAEMFWTEKTPNRGPTYMVGDESLIHLAVALGIDFAAAWQDGTLHQHYRAYLDLCTDGELVNLAREVDAASAVEAMTANRKNLVDRVAKNMPTPDSKEAGPALPAELAKLWKKESKP